MAGLPLVCRHTLGQPRPPHHKVAVDAALAGASQSALSRDVNFEGQKADLVKPMKGFGPGVMEIALRHQTNAYRVVYALEMAGSLWVVHAFQKKSRTGIKTAKVELDLIRERLKRLRKEQLR